MAKAGRRYLALWFALLPIDRLSRGASSRDGVPDEAPFALVEKCRGVIRLATLDPRALALGLMPGLPLADARARVPGLEVFEADPAADREWIERIADWCERYTPMVALEPPHGVTLDVTGCAHLFGGEIGLADDLIRRMGCWTDHLRHAFAATPEAAQALARFQTTPATSENAALRGLDVAALRLPDETITALRRAGLKTIGDLASRPSAPIAARFGEQATAMLARLLNQADSRIVPRRPVPALCCERRLAEPITRTDDVMSVIAALAEEAGQALAARDKGGRRFAIRLFRSDGAVRDLAVDSSLPVRDPAVVARLFRERIETLASPVDPGFGFDMIRMAVPVIEPLAPRQLQLEGDVANEEALAALIDRLSTRLGPGCIRRFATSDTHIPEKSVRTIPAREASSPAAWPMPDAGEPPSRPIFLFDPPQRVEVMAEVPDGPPRRFRWRRDVYDVIRAEGPERIAPEWWRHARGNGLTRDYYRVEDAHGRRFWIFRHGLYDRETVDPDWYVHGLFA
ncbi:MAG: DNA polymerase Y family protein [Pseudomonadota bacterium]|nr:DNA polymerase Y family protein [Pseudomonadota bacterium]